MDEGGVHSECLRELMAEVGCFEEKARKEGGGYGVAGELWG